MADSTIWWLLAGAAVAVELVTGTFYLLMLALGLSAAAVATHLGLGVATQIVVAALVGGVGTGLWYAKRAKAPKSAPASSNRDVNLDIGEPIQITEWQHDRTARVSYRGSMWQVRLQPGALSNAGPHVVVAMEGNVLVLAPTTSANAG